MISRPKIWPLINAFAVFAVSLLVGCGGPPLQEGTYEEEATRLTDNSCPFSEEDFGVGEVELLTVSWPNESTLRLSGGEGGINYDFDGTSSFATSDTKREPVEDGSDCYIVFESEHYGEILSPTSFQIEVEGNIDFDGDCTGWDTTGFPCGASLWLRGELRE